MAFTTIITASELAQHLEQPDWVIVDSRFKLANPAQGQADYAIAHIPGSIYAHLDHDLSGPVTKGVTGRHPLPGVVQMVEVFSRFGIDSGVQVVAYDDVGGALAAARVWWLLRWLGHAEAAVLDGGWQAWVNQKFPTRGGIETRTPRKFIAHPRNELVVSAGEVDAIRSDPGYRLLDARSADRFRGENEVIDPVAGHIPGAISAPYAGNLNPDGTFRADDRLCARYTRLVSGVGADHVVMYCGSGVTAAHDVLSMMKAGLGEARLYAGSYSEWITDPSRPVEK